MAFLLVFFLALLSQILLTTYRISMTLFFSLSLCLAWSSCQTSFSLFISIHLYLSFLHFLFFFLSFFFVLWSLLLLDFFHRVVGILLSLFLLSPNLFLGYALVTKVFLISSLSFLGYTYLFSFFPHDFYRRHWSSSNMWYFLYYFLSHPHFWLLIVFLTSLF